MRSVLVLWVLAAGYAGFALAELYEGNARNAAGFAAVALAFAICAAGATVALGLYRRRRSIIVFGDCGSWESPRMRRARARDLVKTVKL